MTKTEEGWTKSGTIFNRHPYRVSWEAQQGQWAAQKSTGGSNMPECIGHFKTWQAAVRACDGHRLKIKEAWEPVNRDSELNTMKRG